MAVRAKALPDQACLRERLTYNSETGDLLWRTQVPSCAAMIGKPAGSVKTNGYVCISLHGVSYLAHRLVWKLMTGADPINQIDHIDGDRSNNKWSNLRAASNRENCINSRVRRNNKSGATGVCWHGQRGKWRAYIVDAQRRHVSLGLFDDQNDAKRARLLAAEKFYGEFASDRAA